jgi:CDP-diacylglycerol---serine O-phosphatidyltransferase
MFSLKFKNYTLKDNALRYFFLLLSVVLIMVFGIPGIFAIILLYILISLVYSLFLSPTAAPVS